MMDVGLADRLRARGLTVIEVDGWRTRGRTYATFAPRGSVNHHTAGGRTGNAPSLGVCINGRADLPGPLCQAFQARNNVIYVIAAGLSNHAGPGGWRGLAGNASVHGLEVENCLEAGTSILTKRGLIPIEQVQIGEEVWTHRGRWRRVASIWERAPGPAVEIRAAGHPSLVCSPNHRWLTLSAFCGTTNGRPRAFDRHRWETKGHTEQWVEAADLGGHMLLSPTTFPEAEPPDIDGFAVTPELMWVAGSWVANGTTEHHRFPTLAIRLAKLDEVRGHLRSAGLRWSERPAGEIHQIRIASSALGSWLVEHFNEGSLHHTVPAWLLGAGEKYADPFIGGYLHGDGWRAGDKMQVGTSSRCLAFGLRLLAQSMGMYAIVETRRLQYPDGTIIGTRAARQNADSWGVTFWPERRARCQLHDISDWSAGPVRTVRLAPDQTLYDLTVDEDSSFIADGLVTHNCGRRDPAGNIIEPFREDQIDTMAKVHAAFLTAPGSTASADLNCQHYEWTSQKVDALGVDGDDLRDRVRLLLNAPTTPPAPPSEDDVVTYTYVKKPGSGDVFVARHGEPPVHVGSASFGFEAAEAMVRYQGDKLIASTDGKDVPDALGKVRKVLTLNSVESQQWFGI